MRAKLVNELKKAYVFDFDDTLIKTSAKVYIYNNNKLIKSLTPAEYNDYKLQPNDELNFDDFNNPLFILRGKKYKMWPVLQNIYNAKKTGRSNSDIYILTARSEKSKYTISSFLHRNGIILPIENIFTIGDDLNLEQNISKDKQNILEKLNKKYDKIIFFDDNIDNVEMAKNISGVNIRLVDWIK